MQPHLTAGDILIAVELLKKIVDKMQEASNESGVERFQVMILIYVCMYVPYFRVNKTHFFTRIFTLNTGVRLIHKARNLGCFTSSAQATQRSQIDDQLLPQPVSELRLGYDFISIVFITCLARL